VPMGQRGGGWIGIRLRRLAHYSRGPRGVEGGVGTGVGRGGSIPFGAGGVHPFDGGGMPVTGDRPRVFVTRQVPEGALAPLEGWAEVEVWPEFLPPPREELARRLAAVDG